MPRSQRHKIEEQGYTSRGEIYEQGAVNDQILKALGGAVVSAQPVLTSISPTTAAVGAAQFTLTATGSNFTTGNTKILFKGVELVTTFVSATSLTAPVLPVTYGVGTWGVQVRKGGALMAPETKPFVITATRAAKEPEEEPEEEPEADDEEEVDDSGGAEPKAKTKATAKAKARKK